MEEQDTMNERPTKDIKITDCGVLQFQFWERGSRCIQMNPPDTEVGREGGWGGGRVTVNMNLDYSAVYTDLEQYATVIKIS